MNLELQIQSIIVSTIYGMFISLLYNLFYKVLFPKNKIIKLFTNLLFNISISIMFFCIMYLINKGIIHIYFIFLTVIGFIIGNKYTTALRNK